MLRSSADVDSLTAIVQQSHDQNDALTEMIALRCLGERLRRAARYQQAIEAHRKGLEIATVLADTLEMMHASNNLGADYRRMGDLSRANAYHFQALKLSDAYSDKSGKNALRARVTSLNGIGNIEIELYNYSAADSVLRQALAGELQLGNNTGIAKNYGNLGGIKHAIGEIDSAWIFYGKSMEYSQMGDDKLGVAICHMNFGKLHEDERRFSHALEEYEMSYDMLKELDDRWHWLESCLALAHVNILLGEHQDAHRYLDQANAEALRIGSKEFLAKASMIHYELSLLEGNSQQALQFYIQGSELMDSIHGLKKSEEMRMQRNNYERDRNISELDVLNRDITQLKRTRNLQLLFMFLLLLMLAAVGLALAYVVRVRARTQRLMRQIEETRSLFFTNVVHQLRTPLSAIMGSIDRIISGYKSGGGGSASNEADMQENAQVIERQGKNLLVLVDRILEVGGVRSAITELDWRTGDAVTYMHMVIESYRERCVERHIELTYASRENTVDIDTVPRYLNTIVGNLIDNAINYTPDYGKITVTSSVQNNTFVVKVADNGMGISKADLPHVFEPFFRSTAAEAMIEGVGIGLTVVRDMAMAMGGTVAADSMKDKGTVFTVILPSKRPKGVKQRLDDAIEPVVSKAPLPWRNKPVEASADKPAQGLPVVLVVEDHADVARLVGLVLEGEYQVQYAIDGEQGLAKVNNLMPDLIVTDVKMPVMDGLELCRQVRQSPRLCHIPIIMLSARNSDSDRVKGIQAGADAYLVKPFVREELCAWVKGLLENRRLLRAASEQARQQEANAGQDNTGHQPLPVKGEAGSIDEQQAFLDQFWLELDKQLTTGFKLDLDKIALSFKMGESQLRRKIQDITGKNVTAYVTQLRMEKALRLMREDKDLLIGEVADRCGFQDVAYFSRVFRQYYGMTPTQARNTSSAQ